MDNKYASSEEEEMEQEENNREKRAEAKELQNDSDNDKDSLSSSDESDYDDENVPEAETIALRHGYNQTYIIKSSSSQIHEILFRCGNWCYSGNVDLGTEEVTIGDLPSAIPALQKQQGSLQYLCEWKSMSKDYFYSKPLETLYETCDFIAKELSSTKTEKSLQEACTVFSWIDDDESKNYFELQTEGLKCFKDIDIIASKTIVRGLTLIVIFYQQSFYVVLEEGGSEQPLLDVRFPNLSEHLQGLQLTTYNEKNKKKLVLWQSITQAKQIITAKPLKLKLKDVSGSGYNQTFLIRKPHSGGKSGYLREVLFRFGNWCYNGHVDLGPKLELHDIPVIIPLLRRQQSALTFMCETTKMPATSLFAESMEHIAKIFPVIQEELSSAVEILLSMAQSGTIPEGIDAVMSWLDDSNSNCYFEVAIDPSEEFKDVQVIASKVYINSVVLVIMYYNNTFYVRLQDGGDEQPLLDTTFPDISSQGKGYQLKTYRNGVNGCSELRRLSLWRVNQAEMLPETFAYFDDQPMKKEVQQEEKQEKTLKEVKIEKTQEIENEKMQEVKKSEEKEEKQQITATLSPKGLSSLPIEKVALPHHIAPMKGGTEISKLKPLGKSELGPAPWDKTGRPLGLGAKI